MLFLLLFLSCLLFGALLSTLLCRALRQNQIVLSAAAPYFLGAGLFVVPAALIVPLCALLLRRPLSADVLQQAGLPFCLTAAAALALGCAGILFFAITRAPAVAAFLRHPLRRLGGIYRTDAAPADRKAPSRAAALLTVGFLCFAAFCAECFVCNLRALEGVGTDRTSDLYLADDLTVVTGAYRDGNSYVVGPDGAAVSVFFSARPVRSVALELYDHDAIFDLTVGIEDQSSRYADRRSIPFPVHPRAARSLNLAIRSNGDAHAIHLYFPASAAGARLYAVLLNQPPAFRFLYLRFLVIALLLILPYCVVRFRLRQVRCSRNSLPQRIGNVLLVAAMLLLCCFTFYTTTDDATEHLTPYTAETAQSGDVYQQMFDAMMKGRLSLDLPVDPTLAALDNPYDPSLRARAEADYSWDRAFYNGSYYSYFGVTPLLCVYLPVYRFTGLLPDAALVCLLLSLLFVPGAWLLYRQMLRLSGITPTRLTFSLGYLAIVICSNVFWALRRPLFYEVAAISALTFCTWFLYLSIKAVADSPLWFPPAAVACVLMVLSRPTMALYCLPVGVLFLWYLLRRRAPLRRKLFSLGGFALLAALGLALLCAYNYLRFGSFFDFGAAYQLTVSDINYNDLFNLDYIFPAVYHYLLQPPYLSLSFPFFFLSGYPAVHFGNYYFLCPCVGLLFYPVSLLAPFGVPKRGGRNLLWLFRLTLLLAAVGMIYCIMAVAGVLYRYTIDFAFLVTLFGVLGACRLTADRSCSAARCTIVTVLLAASVLAGLALSVSGEGNLFAANRPALFMQLKMAFEWWR